MQKPLAVCTERGLRFVTPLESIFDGMATQAKTAVRGGQALFYSMLVGFAMLGRARLR